MDRINENKDGRKKPFFDYLIKEAEKITLYAAKGNDEVMSEPMPQQQQQQMPGMNEIKGKWKQHVGSAKIAWGELTEDELLKSEGHVQKLAGLIQERYAITLDEAEKQVKSFTDTHKF